MFKVKVILNRDEIYSLFPDECGTCPVFAYYTLAFALQLRKNHGKILSQCSGKMPVDTIQCVDMAASCG
jgi:hypothetical protein